MLLLTEDNFITESEKTAKGWKISGIFLQSELKNRNGRVYPKNIMAEEVNRYIKEMVNTKRALGELTHPASPSINLERVSHRITGIEEDGNNYVGEALVANTDMGRIVSGLLECGTQLGVSSRGLGTLKVINGINEVQNDFKLAAIDCVSDPSGPDCYVNGIMEGVEWIYDNLTGTFHKTDEKKIRRASLLEQHKEHIKKNYKKLSLERKLRMFEQYLNTF